MNLLNLDGNPLYEAWELATLWDLDLLDPANFPTFQKIWKLRRRLSDQYAYAVPDKWIIRSLAELSPIVEPMAGRGYWAALIAAARGDVVASDIEPPVDARTRWFSTPGVYHPVERSDAEDAVRKHANRTLFLCFPPYCSPTDIEDPAFECLRTYLESGGRRLVYIGEGPEGCTAGGRFFNLLVHMRLVEKRSMPRWPTIRDDLYVYEF